MQRRHLRRQFALAYLQGLAEHRLGRFLRISVAEFVHQFLDDGDRHACISADCDDGHAHHIILAVDPHQADAVG